MLLAWCREGSRNSDPVQYLKGAGTLEQKNGYWISDLLQLPPQSSYRPRESPHFLFFEEKKVRIATAVQRLSALERKYADGSRGEQGWRVVGRGTAQARDACGWMRACNCSSLFCVAVWLCGCCCVSRFAWLSLGSKNIIGRYPTYPNRKLSIRRSV